MSFSVASLPAGAFQTPRFSSTRAINPETAPVGGMRPDSDDWSETFTHVKYKTALECRSPEFAFSQSETSLGFFSDEGELIKRKARRCSQTCSACSNDATSADGSISEAA